MRTLTVAVYTTNGSRYTAATPPACTVQYGTGPAAAAEMTQRGDAWSFEVDETLDGCALWGGTGIQAGDLTFTKLPAELAHLDADVSSRSTLTQQQVWEYADRTLSAFGFTPNVGNVTGSLPDVTVAGFAAGVAASLANLIEAALINETDATALLQAIIDKFAATFPDVDELSVAGLVAGMRADIERAGGLLALVKESADAANRVAPDNASAQAAASDALAAKNAAQSAETKATAIQLQTDRLTFNEADEVAASASATISPEDIAEIANELGETVATKQDLDAATASIIDAIPNAARPGWIRINQATLDTSDLAIGTIAPGAVVTAYLKPDETTTVGPSDPATSVGAWFLDLPPSGLWRLRAQGADYDHEDVEVLT